MGLKKIGLVTKTGTAVDGDAHRLRGLQAEGYKVGLFKDGAIPHNVDVDLWMVIKPTIECLLQLRAAIPSAPVLMWHYDAVNYTPGRQQWMRQAERLVDVVVLSDGGYAETLEHGYHAMPGINYLQPPRPLRPVGQHSDLVFAGSWRADRAAAVAAARPTMVFGKHNPGWDRLGLSCLGPKPQESMATWYNGHVGLSVNQEASWPKCVSNRLLLIAGGGGLVFAQRFEGCYDILGEDEAVWFDEPRPYVFHPSHVAIQRRGFERVWRDYNWPRVVRRVMSLAITHLRG